MGRYLNEWLAISLFPAYYFLLGASLPAGKHLEVIGVAVPHPMHVSVVEVNHNSAEKTLEVSCKVFTDDFEKVLAQNYKAKVDLINPADRPAMEKLVSDYVHKHLSLKADGKPVNLSYMGYEKDNDAIYSYFQVENVPSVKKIEISNTTMFDMFTDQINLMHVIVGGNRKSQKLDYPEKNASFSF
ncbi:MAG TPA: DUF6702 family protein [Chitinophagaceae bacterium]|nr:DUF6702 family protein [Chitinophagaceae bacterium]